MWYDFIFGKQDSPDAGENSNDNNVDNRLGSTTVKEIKRHIKFYVNKWAQNPTTIMPYIPLYKIPNRPVKGKRGLHRMDTPSTPSSSPSPEKIINMPGSSVKLQSNMLEKPDELSRFSFTEKKNAFPINCQNEPEIQPEIHPKRRKIINGGMK